MAIFITVNLYSGIPNPTWQLSEADEKNILGIVKDMKNMAEMPVLPFWKLGYRGFSIQFFDENQKQATLHVFHGYVINENNFSAKDYDATLEKYLLQKGLASLTRQEVTMIEESITNNLAEEIKFKKKAFKDIKLFANYPAYNPTKWNGAAVQQNNNCYNYGNDSITNSFAQPGRANGINYTASEITGNIVTRGAKADKLTFLGAAPSTPAQGGLICLVVRPAVDYHWYRLDSNGKWSHKPGKSPCTRLDNSGNEIADPEQADWGIYTQFCGYFNTILSTIKIG